MANPPDPPGPPPRPATMGRLTRALAGGLALSVLGCASIAPERCATVDWRQQGLEDGRTGFGPTRLERHREACARVGVQPDAAAWEAGRVLGLPTYCQLPNALQQGLARHAYEGVCADPRFAQLYGAARRLADARYRVSSVDSQIDWRERELLTSRKLTDERRAELTADLRSLRRERQRTLDDRAEASADLDRTRAALGL